MQHARLRQPRLGTRQLHYRLQRQPRQELQIGGDRLFRLVREHRLRPESVARALRRRRTRQPLVHRAERGVHDCASRYQRLHAKQGVTCSMSDGYGCYQNALAERVNDSLKTELWLQRQLNLEQARTMVGESVLIDNHERPRQALQ